MNIGPAGDLDQDGFADLIFGSKLEIIHQQDNEGDPRPGGVSIVYGRSSFASMHQSNHAFVPESRLDGVTVYYDLNDDLQFDPQTEPHTQTDSTGRYTLDGIPPRTNFTTHQIRMVMSPSGRQDYPGIDWNPGLNWDRDEDYERLDHAYSDGINTFQQNIGVVELPLVFATENITGTVFLDLNGNGVRDEQDGKFIESTLAGQRVYIDQNSNGVLDPQESSTVTMADGTFEFPAFVGDYTIQIDAPAGWAQTPQGSGASGIKVTVEDGKSPEPISFGLKPTLNQTITGVVFNDINMDGKQDANEFGSSGFCVFN